MCVCVCVCVSYLLDVAKVIGSLLILSMLAWADGTASWTDQKDISALSLLSFPSEKRKKEKTSERTDGRKTGKDRKKIRSDIKLDYSIECRPSFFLFHSSSTFSLFKWKIVHFLFTSHHIASRVHSVCIITERQKCVDTRLHLCLPCPSQFFLDEKVST